jgi:hypothetical protein
MNIKKNAPDYRPDLIPQGTFKKNLAVFFTVALSFAIFGAVFWWNTQTPDAPTPVTTASNSVRREIINLPVTSSPNTSRQSQRNTTQRAPQMQLLRCTDSSGIVTYQNSCPPGSNQQPVNQIQSRGIIQHRTTANNTQNKPPQPHIGIVETDAERECKKTYLPLIRRLENKSHLTSTEREKLAYYRRQLQLCINSSR